MFFGKHKKDRKNINDDSLQELNGGVKPTWANSLPGNLYNKWPKKDGVPEEPVFFKHCSSVDMEDELLVNMLSAYGIPAVKHFPANGAFGKVVLGMSGEGTDILIPISMLSDAISLIGGSSDD